MLADYIKKFQSALDSGASFPNTLKFDFGSDGKIFIDGPNKKVTTDDGAAQCTVSTAMADFQSIAEGKLDPTMAFMQGKLKVAGDMSVAMKLKPLIDSAKG